MKDITAHLCRSLAPPQPNQPTNLWSNVTAINGHSWYVTAGYLQRQVVEEQDQISHPLQTASKYCKSRTYMTCMRMLH